MSDGNWQSWFPANTDAWRDYYEQLRNRPNVVNPLGLAMTAYRQVNHPRELGEPWYRYPEGEKRPQSYLERYRESLRREPPASEETRKLHIQRYFDSIRSKRSEDRSRVQGDPASEIPTEPR